MSLHEPDADAEQPSGREDQTWLQYWGPAIAVSLAMFIAVIDSTLMNVAIPAIVEDLDTTVPVVQGAIAFYSLVMAALVLPGGKLPTIFGIRRLTAGALIVYAVGTLLAAISWNPIVLFLGWSVIEGAAAAVLLPLTFTIIVVSYEGTDRAKALGVLAGVNATGAAIGPILGGALTTFASWRWGFALEAVIVVVALLFVRYLSAERLTPTRESLDLGGTVLSALGATTFVAGFILSGKYGFLTATRSFFVGNMQFNPFGTSPAIWLVGIGLLMFAAFTQYELRVARTGQTPLVPIDILQNRLFTSGILTLTARSIVMAGFIFVVPVFLQSALGYSAFEAGLAMLPFSIATLLTSMFTTGWRSYVSPKTLVQAGIVFMGVGLVLLAGQTSPDQTIVGMALPMATFGVGVGLVMAQLVDLTLSSVRPENSADASGVMNATGMLGYAVGTAVVGSFLLGRYYGNAVDGLLRTGGVTVSPQRRDELVVALQDAAETATEATQQAFLNQLSPGEQELLIGIFESAFVSAQRSTLLLLCLLALAMLAVSSLIPRVASGSQVESASQDGRANPPKEATETVEGE
jgi:MFS family permease